MNTNHTLEFTIILEKLAEFALSEAAKEKLLSIKPLLNEAKVEAQTKETTEAKIILEHMGSAPLTSMEELNKIITLCEKGSMLIPEQLTDVAQFINNCRRMKSYLRKAQDMEISIAFYANAINDLDDLREEIERSIRNGQVDNMATSDLRDIRRKIENANDAIKTKLESVLKGKKEWFADSYVTTRGGRYVLPVKKEYKNQISGTVIDTSGAGGTYFIEPTQVRKLADELNLLKIDEDNEIRKILYTLTALVGEYANEIKVNMDCMETLDFVFAKAKLSLAMEAIPVTVNTQRKIRIRQGRHPLIKADECIPLNIEIGEGYNGVIITGPNTGGKTVSLKTVGLLSMMAQSGLHVPVAPGSGFCMNANVLCDIGDGQSITENLSTFSAHITNIIEILKNTSEESLVLLDELGSGTDPAEGMGLAVSILEELRKKGCLFIATTHYPEIKEYAKKTDKIINARMEFDRESLKPLYKLQIGEAGESCALYIAKRLGLPAHMLNLAYREAYGEDTAFSSTGYDTFEPVLTEKIIQKEIGAKTLSLRKDKFQMGDSVKIYPQKETGIVYKLANEKGELIIQIKGEKYTVNHKRVKLLVPASELYPDMEQYDFSVIFDTVENRKARSKADKHGIE